jgi:hypothetical protein
MEDPDMATKGLLRFTGLEELKVERVGINGEALAQTQPGSWPKFIYIYISYTFCPREGLTLDEAQS